MKSKGFTMIELLVVMAILASFMTMGLSAYAQSMRRGRDARRVEDMQGIQKGFETYYAKSVDQSYGTCAAMFADTTIFPNGAPTPPAGGLVYTGDCTLGTTYYYAAQLEIPKDYGNATVGGGTCTFVPKSSATHYCVKNVQ